MRTGGLVVAGLGGFLLAGGYLLRERLKDQAGRCAIDAVQAGMNPLDCEPTADQKFVYKSAFVVGGFSIIAGGIMAIRG